MNSPLWSYPFTPYYQPTTPSNFYSHPNTAIQTSLNSSSGYESATNETSFIDPCFARPSFTRKESTPMYDDIHMDEDSMSSENNENRKKRRILSRPQRQEANRRERQRMDIINQAYEELRNVLPFKKGRKRQKMSRMDTVDGAIRYIHTLLETLHGPNYNPDWAK
ncbi:unnamed protein product [Rotaria magnacalcarata]|uniref:BHLH domain-containing protein n=1 Tax=Rotaria magnacalcarata TaxID=392030 RepID=A0A819NBC7_9BILA|nr:unnamed protein product [Rotaria magnacalcarata]CAF3994356.1 unnamed protein product [Rotaria magnacalcarata]